MKTFVPLSPKKCVLAFGCACALAPIAHGVTLLHYWDFEGGYNDKAGASNGTAGAEVSTITGQDGNTGAFFPSAVTGGGAFDSTGYVDIAPATNVSGAFSMSYWVQLPADTSTDGRGIFDFSGDGGDGPQSLFIQSGGNAGNLAFRVDGSGTSNAVAFVTVPEDNSWFHIAANFDPSGNLAVYLNGTPSASVLASGVADATWDVDQYLGAFNVNTLATRGLNGGLDDVAIFSGLLTESEISGLADRSLTPPDLVPEPSTGLLVGLSGLALLLRRRK
ncbi:hypothetical protein NT6N_39580 [Oceaniferula spumae]|uniref:Ice-binding protein C-terminal domain-containing protein n=1 Tax=Oceaniferula spumae TaxID=2979115 RepID=A0AAT9FSF0_9BACT